MYDLRFIHMAKHRIIVSCLLDLLIRIGKFEFLFLEHETQKTTDEPITAPIK